MKTKRVKDLSLPLSEYPVVGLDSTLKEALETLRRLRSEMTNRLHRPRAVLVADQNGEITGQVGHLDFLKALEPKYSMFGDLGSLARAGISEDFIASVMDNFSIMRGSLDFICSRAMDLRVSQVMRSVSESIDENALLTEAIHKLVMWQSMRILVTKEGRVAGVLRLSDVFNEVSDYLIEKMGNTS